MSEDSGTAKPRQEFFNVATFNAANLISANTVYYRSKDRPKGNVYSDAAYHQKLEWMTEQLVRMDADLIAFQEIFESGPLEDLARRYATRIANLYQGDEAARRMYGHVLHVPNASAKADDPAIGLGFLSRKPILNSRSVQDLAGSPITVASPGDGDGDFSMTIARLSRPIGQIEIEMFAGLRVWLFNAHLKSRLPTIDEDSPEADENQLLFLKRSEGTVRSLVRRAGEAMALRRMVLDARAAGKALIVLGDLNDDISAVTTELIGGEIAPNFWNNAAIAGFRSVQLHSTVRLFTRRSEGAEPISHIHDGYGAMLDHVLVSPEFVFAEGKLAEVVYVRCLADHLADERLKGRRLAAASDHGQLIVTFARQVPAAAAPLSDQLPVSPAPPFP